MNSVCLDSSLVNEVSSIGPELLPKWPGVTIFASPALYLFFLFLLENPLLSIPFLMSFIDHMVFNGLYVEYAIIDEAVPYGAMQQSSDHEM